MTDLPIDIDDTYGDDPTRPGRKLHQQHHDALHALHNRLAGASSPIGDLVYWGIYTTPRVITDGGDHVLSSWEDDYVASTYTDEDNTGSMTFVAATGVLTINEDGLYRFGCAVIGDDATPSPSKVELRFDTGSATRYEPSAFIPIVRSADLYGDSASGNAFADTTVRLLAGTTVTMRVSMPTGGDDFSIIYAEFYARCVA